MKTVTRVCFIALALLLMVTPLVACGGAETPPPSPPPPSPTGNQSPVITSLTPEEPTLIPNAKTRITCIASDPDGDKPNYTWSATGGDITATYSDFIIWQAPGFAGEFTVSVTIDDGKGGSASKSCTINVQVNQRPVISSLTAEPAELQREETSTVTCLAGDPDGDELTYTWSATGGDISGIGNIVTWKAPAVGGEFLISVKVEDGKGGITESSCMIAVVIPEVTIILTPLAGESGSIYYDGGLIPALKIGDNAQNVGVRPYFSFDISGLAGAEIKEAKLTFTIKESIGNIWLFAPPFLYLELIEYGARPLQSADFHSVLFTGELKRYDSTPPTEIDVSSRLTNTINSIKPRFQLRLRLATNNNLNNLEDYIEFSKVELTVTYAK